MGRLAVINGVHCAPEAAVVSVYDRGFLYGDTVFETLRTYEGMLFALDEHMRRLEQSAELLSIPLPMAPAKLGACAQQAVASAANEESYCRVIVSRGSGPLGLDTSFAGEPLWVMLIEPLPAPDPRLWAEGLTAMCVQTVRASDAAHSAKLGNYLASALALRDARAAGFDEALVVNQHSHVVEGTTANLFTIKGDTVSTPPIDAGILSGITRAVIVEIAQQVGLGVEYRSHSPAELTEQDEVFLTSSVREVIPIVCVDGTRIGIGKPGSTTRAIHAAFRARVSTPH